MQNPVWTRLCLLRQSWTRQCARRAGFTLIELMVVMAIIGVLVSMLLPAVQAAREAARRTQCMNNVKQLALALHNYADINHMFPPGHLETGMENPLPGQPSGQHQTGLLTYLLPYVEQTAVYEKVPFDAINLATNVNKVAAFWPAAGTYIGSFVCPSDPMQLVALNTAPANYMGNQGTDCMCQFSTCNGVFGHSTFTKLAWITDGTSTTIAISETLRGDNNPATLADNYIYTKTSPANAQDVTTCQTFAPNASDRGLSWIGGQPQYNMFSTNRVPNDALYDCIANNYGCSNLAARSAHANGVIVGMCDGAVHFMNQYIDRTTYQALGTRSGGEIVSMEF